MREKSGKEPVETSAMTAYLKLAADSKWITRRTYNLWLTTDRWRTELIRKMQDNGYISCINLNRKKSKTEIKQEEESAEIVEELPNRIYGMRYALTSKGRKYLQEFNPIRYPLGSLEPDTNDYKEQRMYRLSLLGEMRAMSERVGYSIHPDTKPDLIVLSGLPLTRADRPAMTATITTEIPPRYKGYENSIYNAKPFQYYAKHFRTHYGYDYLDIKTYTTRETPIGCVYTLPELRLLVELEANHCGVNKEESDKIRFTRLSGVFFSGAGTYGIYNTERTAIKLRRSGEDAIRAHLNEWSSNVYKRSLTIMRSDNTGNLVEETIEPKVRGYILFGDFSYQAAISVVQHTIRNETGFGKDTKLKLNQNYNLRILPNTYYIPVIRESLPVYALMSFPHWPMYIKEIGKRHMTHLHEKGEAPALIQEYPGENSIDGKLKDGSTFITLISMHIDTVCWMVTDLAAMGTTFTIAVMEWQRPFFDRLVEELPQENADNIKVHYIPQTELTGYVEKLYADNDLSYPQIK